MLVEALFFNLQFNHDDVNSSYIPGISQDFWKLIESIRLSLGNFKESIENEPVVPITTKQMLQTPKNPTPPSCSYRFALQSFKNKKQRKTKRGIQ